MNCLPKNLAISIAFLRASFSFFCVSIISLILFGITPNPNGDAPYIFGGCVLFLVCSRAFFTFRDFACCFTIISFAADGRNPNANGLIPLLGHFNSERAPVVVVVLDTFGDVCVFKLDITNDGPVLTLYVLCLGIDGVVTGSV